MLLLIYLLIGLIIGLIAYSGLNPEEYNNTFKIWFFILAILGWLPIIIIAFVKEILE